MHQFFVGPNQIEDDTAIILGKDVNHIKNVLRMKIGEEIRILNGRDDKEFCCQIEKMEEEQVLCKIRFVKQGGLELPAQVFLFQGLPKGDKMDLIVQKSVELGVTEIIPVATKRSIVKLDEKKAGRKEERWNKISEAAAKQSRRQHIPKVRSVMEWQEALNYAKEFEVKLIPYELSSGMEETKGQIESIAPGQRVGIFIGPEGGFEEEEINLAKEGGAIPITLGKRILRTETAGFTILAWIMYHLEKE
ncbi:16S rRNA (uracil(1498)-N(3))-methyltransferase [bacterium 1XD42-8]|jgi:16S rRNA (uracil1498-N3)-methyltransferase|nr:16S rRNA (uracil(1498)-N(3))-methyltransferase [Lachnospiraceae bacterium]RKJ43371.1 16S rRNA (uracil(1498)-N(3))-methyltransferase [bacterium 1XD42-8]